MFECLLCVCDEEDSVSFLGGGCQSASENGRDRDRDRDRERARSSQWTPHLRACAHEPPKDDMKRARERDGQRWKSASPASALVSLVFMFVCVCLCLCDICRFCRRGGVPGPIHRLARAVAGRRRWAWRWAAFPHRRTDGRSALRFARDPLTHLLSE